MNIVIRVSPPDAPRLTARNIASLLEGLCCLAEIKGADEEERLVQARALLLLLRHLLAEEPDQALARELKIKTLRCANCTFVRMGEWIGCRPTNLPQCDKLKR